MKEIGKIAISFDCEGKWGMIDENKPWINNLSKNNLYEIYEFILNVLEINDLKATFGFVGALLESESEFRRKAESLKKGTNHKRWIEKFDEKYKSNDDGYFLPELRNLFADNRHELATHGYCHIPFSLLTEKEAIKELELVESQMKEAGIDYSSMIFPRNKVAHQKLLKNYGIKRYRELPNHFNVPFFPAKVNSLLEGINVFKKAEHQIKGHVPGGIMMHWFYGYRKVIPISVINKKHDSLIQDAIKHSKCAHIWLHPHNLITSSKSKNMFIDLCKIIKNKISAGDLLNVTFDQLS